MPLERPRFRQKLGRWYRMFFKGVVSSVVILYPLVSKSLSIL